MSMKRCHNKRCVKPLLKSKQKYCNNACQEGRDSQHMKVRQLTKAQKVFFLATAEKVKIGKLQAAAAMVILNRDMV